MWENIFAPRYPKLEAASRWPHHQKTVVEVFLATNPPLLVHFLGAPDLGIHPRASCPEDCACYVEGFQHEYVASLNLAYENKQTSRGCHPKPKMTSVPARLYHSDPKGYLLSCLCFPGCSCSWKQGPGMSAALPERARMPGPVTSTGRLLSLNFHKSMKPFS